jgi:dTDP-3-amino-2,3,6-trideoxy-4-keto-D-glucose/dTDP-3-amino-3,4,6-trideoxy-alpha-D-glucose/dTDP-2,6-dideoxy-D-kanosamine transaminase
MTQIPVFDLARQLAPQRGELEAAVLDVIRRGHFVLGHHVAAFEAEFAAYCGAAHAVGMGNGTDALELALRALGVGLGDRVVTTANAGGYGTAAIRACGAVPLYVDVDRRSMQVDIDDFERAMSAGPSAAIVTHLYGRLADVEGLQRVAVGYGVPLVEDCAQAHGARLHGQHAGTFGSIGCFSFYPTKNLGALGDGGATITHDEDLATSLRTLRQYGWRRKYHVERAGGRNSRLDELQAAVLRHRLPALDGDNRRRRAIAERYHRYIENALLEIPVRQGESDVVHLFVVLTRHRDALAAHLAAHNIDSDVHYPVPDHRQPGLPLANGVPPLHVTEQLARQVLSLPSFPAMSEEEIVRVIDACNSFAA